MQNLTEQQEIHTANESSHTTEEPLPVLRDDEKYGVMKVSDLSSDNASKTRKAFSENGITFVYRSKGEEGKPVPEYIVFSRGFFKSRVLHPLALANIIALEFYRRSYAFKDELADDAILRGILTSAEDLLKTQNGTEYAVEFVEEKLLPFAFYVPEEDKGVYCKGILTSSLRNGFSPKIQAQIKKFPLGCATVQLMRGRGKSKKVEFLMDTSENYAVRLAFYDGALCSLRLLAERFPDEMPYAYEQLKDVYTSAGFSNINFDGVKFSRLLPFFQIMIARLSIPPLHFWTKLERGDFACPRKEKCEPLMKFLDAGKFRELKIHGWTNGGIAAHYGTTERTVRGNFQTL